MCIRDRQTPTSGAYANLIFSASAHQAQSICYLISSSQSRRRTDQHPFAKSQTTRPQHNRIHSGISINGSNVGRMTQEEAVALISKQAQEVAKKEMHLTADEQTWTVIPENLGLRIDASQTVSRAFRLTRDGSFMNNALTSLRLYWEPTRLRRISYAVFCLKKKTNR